MTNILNFCKLTVQFNGEVSEWPMVTVLKTVVCNSTEGSNPSFSDKTIWKGARVAEPGSLLRSCTRKGTGGSNPPLSVFFYNELFAQKLFVNNLTFKLLKKNGRVSEWSKEHAWKVCVSQGTEGSNPSLSDSSLFNYIQEL